MPTYERKDGRDTVETMVTVEGSALDKTLAGLTEEKGSGWRRVEFSDADKPAKPAPATEG